MIRIPEKSFCMPVRVSAIMIGRVKVNWVAVIAGLLLLAGCAAPVGDRPAERRIPWSPPGEQYDSYWWQACLRMPFDAQGEPRWAVDLLLAQQVLAPLLEEHAAGISLWRFHRRAANDAAGHQLSLIFYSDEQTANQIFAALEGSPRVAALIDDDYLQAVITRCRHDGSASALEATSDPSWDARLQKTWPYYIMGVSAHWLALIEEVGRNIPADAKSNRELLQHYAWVESEIITLWQEQGQHAYLHHLNALFGYRPMLIQRYYRF